jgi:hypothetical protein
MELKQIIAIIVIVAIVGIILFRTLPIKVNRSKRQQAEGKEKTD